MQRITCPYCGPRDQSEFRFGGENNGPRPLRPEQLSDAEWADYLFYRDNVKGRHRELWVHDFGCRQWFEINRDTLSHEVYEIRTLGDGQPPSGGAEAGGSDE